jgi:hypothetical protein
MLRAYPRVNDMRKTVMTMTLAPQNTATLLMNSMLGTMIREYVTSMQYQSGPTYARTWGHC